MRDPRSIAALYVTERFARGRATSAELRAAAAEAAEAAWVAWVAAEAAAEAEAEAAGAWAAQTEELRRICRDIEEGRDPYPEEGGR